MRSLSNTLSIIVISIALSVGTSYALLSLSKGQSTHRETSYERVMRTGTVRCGYVLSQPATYIDLKSGKLSGFMVDIVNLLGQRLGLHVVWSEEVSFGNMFEGLTTGRYDAICSGSWISAGRSRAAEFTTPFLYSYVTPIVRADDDRFDGALSAANTPNTTISVIDGDVTAEIATSDFPNAKVISTPQGADSQQVFLDVMSHKADMTFDEWTKVQLFMQKNPSVLKTVKMEKPLRIFPWGIAVAKGEHTLETLFNGALTEILFSGYIEQIVKRNQPIPHSYFFVKPSIQAD